MVIDVEREGTASQFRGIVEKVCKNTAVKGLFILACDENNFTPELVDPVLRDIKIPVFGGIFPGVLFNEELLERGTVVCGLYSEPDVQVVQNLSSDDIAFDDIIDEKFPCAEHSKSMFVIVDGMAKRIYSLLESLFNLFGLELSYLGGGAGSLSLKMKPCIFTNEGLLQDSAVLAMTDEKVGIGVAHGMKSVCGPYKITEATGNTVYSLNWEPAYLFYKKEIKENANFDPDDSDFFGVNRHFSLGVNRLGSEKIVREPVILGQDNSLSFFPEMREGEFVDILRATPDLTIQASGKAAEIARNDCHGPKDCNTIICFDCVARRLFLQDRYSEEIRSLYDGTIPLIGALTIGEIANSGREFIDYYNRTCVVGAVDDKL